MYFFQMIFLNQKATFFHMQTLVFFSNGVIGVPMINVDASAGKKQAGDRTKDKEKPSLEIQNTAIPRNLFSNNNQRSR